MPTTYLVSCVSKKLERPTEAQDLYISAWFKKAKAYVEQAGSAWYILSAKHGLLDPTEVISPYDKTLRSLPKGERREWARGVLQSLENKLSRGDTVIFLAGITYREFLTEPLQQIGVKVVIPMKGLAIGKQNQWLLRKLAKRPTVSRT